LEQKAGQRATRLKRKYEKATVTADGETKTLPYEGKTVLIEKKGEKYTFRIEGGDELSGADARELDSQFNQWGTVSDEQMEKAILPNKAVKVNEEWQLDPAALAQAFKDAVELDPAKTSGMGRLERAYKKGGRQFGVLVFRLKIAPRALLEKGKRVPLEPGAAWTTNVRWDVCIDGSTTTTNSRVMEHNGSFELLVPSPDMAKGRAQITGKTKITGKTVEQ
jgi:hypothetical protein